MYINTSYTLLVKVPPGVTSGVGRFLFSSNSQTRELQGANAVRWLKQMQFYGSAMFAVEKR